MDYFGAHKMTRFYNSGLHSQNFFEILHNRYQEVHESYINDFSEKILVWGKSYSI